MDTIQKKRIKKIYLINFVIILILSILILLVDKQPDSIKEQKYMIMNTCSNSKEILSILENNSDKKYQLLKNNYKNFTYDCSLFEIKNEYNWKINIQNGTE